MNKRKLIPLHIAAIFLNLVCANPPKSLVLTPNLLTSLIHIFMACVMAWMALDFPFIEKTQPND